MGGVRLSGVAQVVSCSLPFTMYTPVTGEYNAFRICYPDVERITNHLDPDFAEEMNNALLSPDGTMVIYQENFPEISPGVFSGAIYSVPYNAAGAIPSTLMADDGGAGGDWLLHPFWNPDGVGCVYIHGLSGFVGNIEAVAFAGDAPTTLYTPDASHGPFRPQYSPDGTQIAFILEPNIGTPDGDTGLWVMDADGSNLAQIDVFPNDGYGFDGSQFGWSHDSLKIIVNRNQSFSGGGAEVYMMDRDGSNQVFLTGNGETQARVSNRCWAPDDSYAVISNKDAGTYRPYRVELDGSGGTYLGTVAVATADDVQNFRCVYIHEPDGRVYMVQNAAFGAGAIASVKLDGTDERQDISGQDIVAGVGIEWI